MFIDELRVPVPPQQDTEVVEPSDDALQLDTVDQKYCQRDFLFADMIEKRVLQILGSFSGHFFSLCYVLFVGTWGQPHGGGRYTRTVTLWPGPRLSAMAGPRD